MVQQSKPCPPVPSFSTPKLLACVRKALAAIPDHRQEGKCTISLVDALMSGLALFALKFPSLLKFDEQRHEDHIRYNLETLYGVTRAPCDTQLRDILDPLEPTALHAAFRALFQCVQASPALDRYRILGQFLMVSIDGTGQYSSSAICCPECAIKQTRAGETLYYHQMVAAAIVHPDCQTVIPLIPEPILRHDGDTKNDCELTAVTRLITRLRQDYPTLPLLVVEDALFAKGPHLKLLKEKNIEFIIGVKEGDHASLFEAVQAHEENDTMGGLVQHDEKRNITRIFRFVNGLDLNKSHPDVKVNFLEYVELKGGRFYRRFTWVTSLEITENNCHDIMRGGRARWKVENETFNTLKNQGYRFEHNYGHGREHLATNLALLMMLAFFIDQIQELAGDLFQRARQRFRSRTSLWERMRALFVGYFIDDWEIFWSAIIRGHQVARLQPKPAGPNDTT